MALLQKQQIACAKTAPAARRSVARVVVCKASKASADGEVVSGRTGGFKAWGNPP